MAGNRIRIRLVGRALLWTVVSSVIATVLLTIVLIIAL
jgi:hypothetical protein